MKQIHYRLRKLRHAAALTQGQVGTAVGVTKQAVCAWEHGRTTPPGKHLPKLARVLGVTIDELYRKATV